MQITLSMACSKKLLLILIVISGGIVNAGQNDNSKRPNVLIIQPDQHRGDIMGCAGDIHAKTPNLDKMADEGVHFINTISATPVCSPFRATLQTGLYIHQHGIFQNGRTLKPEITGIAEIFTDAGYATGYIGKWHLAGFIPKDGVGGWVKKSLRHGWQEWNGYEKSHELFEVWKFNNNKKKERVEGYDWEPTWHTDIALDFIERKTREGKPWCYYIAYGPPHKPEQCPQKYLDMFPPEEFDLQPDVEKNLDDDQKKELRELLQIYYGQVTAVDFEVGRLIQGLRDMGIEGNTIIVYVSDHGDVLGSHHLEIKNKYREEINRNLNNTLRTKGKPYMKAMDIPFIVQWKGNIKSGFRCKTMVSSLDLAPTILDLAGLDIPKGMEGYSMAGWCKKGKGKKRKSAYIGLHDGRNAWRGIWDGRYLYSELRYEVLYDHKNDPYEMNNLFDDKNYSKLKEKLHKNLIKLIKKSGDPIIERMKE